jgi:peptidoglycan hydrolase CwlO-like protein
MSPLALTSKRSRMSHDNQYLFTAGEDSCIYMMKIISSEPQNLRGAAQIQYSEDVLISRSELVQQLRTLPQAQQNIQELENEQRNKLQSLKQDLKQNWKEIKDKIKEEQDSEKANVEELEKKIAALTEDVEAQRGSIETQIRQESQQKNARS